MTSAMDAAMSGGQELTDVQDSLRAELMAEIEGESADKKEPDKQIKEELKQ